MYTLIGEAIILDLVRHREAGKRVLLSTHNSGHLSVIAPNATRSKRRFIGGLNLFSRIEYSLECRNELMVLSESLLIDEYEIAFLSTGSFITASVLCEIAMRLYSVNNPNETAFLLLKYSFEHMQAGVDLDCVSTFLIRSMNKIGESPMLNTCAVCQGRVNKGSLLFNYYKGGVLCRGCARSDPRGEHISRDLFEFLTSDSAHRVNYAEKIKRQAIFLLERYLQFRLNIRLTSLRFI